ncbi:acetolactate synthase, large subunit, biosynthetic type [Oleidesulfovibrio alaskensis G20]|jgi:acetolactate synthase-1/2/3 large subunit|uniref:Acetolactate synthase n=1 Tax=Oleidesulfovibrio alaskensis (strain ATCC BAA-1058 / DSM 17464 / G20) TaxID=207559 RepID=Q316E7_OLEA2|nr:acetolactate synthase, large subunit, biosynthetic type [Oleidesulfovibrio alaskensis G20]
MSRSRSRDHAAEARPSAGKAAMHGSKTQCPAPEKQQPAARPERMTGAAAVVRMLERQGVRHVAGIPGGASLPLYDALAARGSIRHILTRHEQAAGFIAQGMARATGVPAVCLATSGPGATNILTALADAKLDSVPVVCITGQVPTTLIGTDAFQEVDTYGMSIPVTKHNFLVRTAQELLSVIPEAFRIAASGRPGPVLVDIPRDVQLATLEIDSWPGPGLPDAPLMPDMEDVVGAAAMIDEAERPLMYLGGGVISSGAAPAARRIAEKAGIPVAMTLMGLGAVPSEHPLSLGMLGMHAARCTNMAMEECDLLIVAGARFDDRATGRVDSFCPRARVIHIDIDASELDKIRSAHLGIQGDVRATLEALEPLVAPCARENWLHRVEELRNGWGLDLPRTDDPVSPYGMILRTAEIVGPEAVVTTDVGQHQMRTAQAYPFSRPRQWLTSGGLGTMGFGLPAAIGAALACPERTVVCFTGDGSLQMNIQELATAVEQRCNIKIILANNNALGLVQQLQNLFFERRVFATDYSVQVDFVRIAEGFGMPAVDLGASRDPLGMLEAALTTAGPCLVNIPVAVSESVFPMVPPGAANTEMIEGDGHDRTEAAA